MSDFLKESDRGTLLFVRLTPKASADRIGPLHEGRVKIAVTTAPEKGKANAHLIKMLAKRLDVPKSAIELVGGETDRAKTLLIRGLSPAVVRDKLAV